MKRSKLIRFAGSLLLATAVCGAWAGEVIVIANAGTSIEPGDVKEIYLGGKQLAGSVKLVPVDNTAAQADFLARVVKMDAGKYASAWTKKSFRDGIAAPAVKGSDEETVEFVKHTPGGVGYVTNAPAGVKVIGKF